MQGKIIFELLDVGGSYIRDDVSLFLYNQRVKTKSQRRDVRFQGEPQQLDVEAMPDGIYDVLIIPEKYRSKRTFAIVPAGGSQLIREIHFLKPDRVTPKFQRYSALMSDPEWKAILQAAKLIEGKYGALEELPKACFFNICAKMRNQKISRAGDRVIDHLGEIVDFRRERFYAHTDRQLLDRVKRWQEFETAPGAMHEFPGGWTRIEKKGSFKTTPIDRAGILQLTFARNNGDGLLVDSDIDDHKGIQHAFDVIKHKFSGETHPYDIHQILLFFQGLDPGYSLS